jgi:probable HAF family extracellular repeat protein
MKFRMTPFILAVAAAPLWAAPPTYSITELPALGQQLNTSSINGHGDIVGNVIYRERYWSAFVYRKSTGVIRDIGSGSAPSTATSINLSGQIVGSEIYATSWSPAGKESMLPGSSVASQANGINPDGLIVGLDSARAVYWKNNTLHVIPDTGALWSAAMGVGPLGHIVGSMDIGGITQAFLYFNGTTKSLGVLPGGTFSEALAVNSWGEAVGNSETTGTSYRPLHAVLYSHGVLKDLGTLAKTPGRLSGALGINNHDEIVGYSEVDLTAGGTTQRAFVYVDGSMYNLSFLLDYASPIAAYTRLRVATAINCNGWIAADGYDTRDPNTGRSYLLIPERPLRSECPVP